MAPPKYACELLLTTQINIVKIIKRVRSILEKVKKIVSTKSKLKYGIIDLSDVIGAEAFSVIASVAASVGHAMLGSVSKMAGAILEAILFAILKILLSYPTAIFSLIAIPHNQALKAVHEERLYLIRAKRSLRIILAIILKWTRGPSGRRFYEQMVLALPHINRAIELAVRLINDLEGDPTNVEEGEVRNAVFNEGRYKLMQRSIDEAIQITTPESIIDNRYQITKAVEIAREQEYQKMAVKINADYKQRRLELFRWYSTETQKISNLGDSLPNAIKAERLRNQFSARKLALDTDKKEKLAVAELAAASASIVNKSAYVKAAGGVAAQFVNDMNVLGAHLGSFVGNIKDAYAAYQRSQNLCNAIYKIRDLIRKLINEIIDALRRVSNASATIAIKALETAQAMLEITKDDFEEAISRFENASEKISSIEMSGKIAVGHGLLVGSDAVLNGAITQSLMDLINSDDVLDDANQEFADFIERLKAIPDWDGKLNIWATNPTVAAVSPYIQMIADATSALVKVPSLSLSNEESDRTEVRLIINSMNRTFRNLLIHNFTVSNTLQSYQPYMSSEAGNLIRILKNAGLLEGFATSMSIAAATADIVSSVVKGGLDDTMPTYRNCRSSYPALYENAEAAEAAALSSGNISPPPVDITWQAKAEDNEIKVIGARENINSYNMNNAIPDDGFNQPAAEVSSLG